MDNICLLGLGLLGLIYFSSKNNNILTSTDSLSKTGEIVYVDSKDQMDVILHNLMSNKFMNVNNSVVVWEVPLDEIFKNQTSHQLNSKYLKFHDSC